MGSILASRDDDDDDDDDESETALCCLSLTVTARLVSRLQLLIDVTDTCLRLIYRRASLMGTLPHLSAPLTTDRIPCDPQSTD